MNITIETCELGRNESGGTASGGWQTLTAPQGKYNFINKIIDGITVTINAVNIKFKSPAFIASIQVRDFMHIVYGSFLALHNIYRTFFFVQLTNFLFSLTILFRCHGFVSNQKHQNG